MRCARSPVKGFSQAQVVVVEVKVKIEVTLEVTVVQVVQEIVVFVVGVVVAVVNDCERSAPPLGTRPQEQQDPNTRPRRHPRLPLPSPNYSHPHRSTTIQRHNTYRNHSNIIPTTIARHATTIKTQASTCSDATTSPSCSRRLPACAGSPQVRSGQF